MKENKERNRKLTHKRKTRIRKECKNESRSKVNKERKK